MNWPLVTVIVTHHLNENDRYLIQCMQSLFKSVYSNFKVLIVSDAPTEPWYTIDPRFSLHWSPNDPAINRASTKVDYAMEHLDPETKYVLLLSDDVCVSPWLLEKMIRVSEGMVPCIMNPLSNSDCGTRFFPLIPMHPGINWSANYEYEELEGKIPDILNIAPTFDLLTQTDYVSFYCTLMRVETFKLIGPLNAKLDYRYNDTDYCMRGKKLGIPSVIHLGAFALHFGSKTLSKIVTPEDYAACDAEFQRLYYPVPRASDK